VVRGAEGGVQSAEHGVHSANPKPLTLNLVRTVSAGLRICLTGLRVQDIMFGV